LQCQLETALQKLNDSSYDQSQACDEKEMTEWGIPRLEKTKNEGGAQRKKGKL